LLWWTTLPSCPSYRNTQHMYENSLDYPTSFGLPNVRSSNGRHLQRQNHVLRQFVPTTSDCAIDCAIASDGYTGRTVGTVPSPRLDVYVHTHGGWSTPLPTRDQPPPTHFFPTFKRPSQPIHSPYPADREGQSGWRCLSRLVCHICSEIAHAKERKKRSHASRNKQIRIQYRTQKQHSV
ncbi:unnamed protein product, partial [Ectocarpus fasciculatus]